MRVARTRCDGNCHSSDIRHHAVNPLDELHKLTESFPEDSTLIEHAEHVPSALTPEPYKRMLVHDHHMTIAMESYHRSSVDVRVLDQHLDGDVYSRKIILVKAVRR